MQDNEMPAPWPTLGQDQDQHLFSRNVHQPSSWVCCSSPHQKRISAMGKIIFCCVRMRLTVPDFNKKNAIKMFRKSVNYGTGYVGRNLDMSKYVFTPPAPIAVRNKVSSREDKSKRGLCLQEMALMLACWNEHDYSETICSKEIQTFETCWKDAEKQEKLVKEQERLGLSNTGRLTATQANKLLKRFPEPEKT